MPPSPLENLPDALASAKTRPLFVMRLSSRMQVIGSTPGYVRRVGAVFGGVFEGERLSGEVLDSGNDWQTVRGDGAVTLDVRLVLKTDDEAMIGMTYRESGPGRPRSWRASIAAKRSTRRAIIFALRLSSRPRPRNTTGSIGCWRSASAIAAPMGRFTACSNSSDRLSFPDRDLIALRRKAKTGARAGKRRRTHG